MNVIKQITLPTLAAMKPAFLNTRKFLLLVCGLVFSISIAGAQNYKAITQQIDSFAKAGLPKSALVEVNKLDSLARKNNSVPQQVKAAVYRVAFQSDIEEDALPAVINQLRSDIRRSDYPVKPVLQSLLAQAFWNYYTQYRYQISQRTPLEKPDTDFTRWDLRTIINQTTYQYKLSLSDTVREQNTPIGVLDGVLAGDSTTRYLRPTLYDLLVQQALRFFLSDESGLTKPKLPFSLDNPAFFGDSRAFANLNIITTDTASAYYNGIRLLQQATLFHLDKNNRDAVADLDLQRLQFVYQHSSLSDKDSLYMDGLKKITTGFSSSPLSADALVLQGKYYMDKDSLATALNYFLKAQKAYPKSIGGINATAYISQIKMKSLTVQTESYNLPGKPVLAAVDYKNVGSAKVFIYKISKALHDTLVNLPDQNRYGRSDMIQSCEPVYQYLQKLKPFRTQDVQLPGTADYRVHTAEFKIDSLPLGIYVLVAKDALSDSLYSTGLLSFNVTRLSYASRRIDSRTKEVRVFDRDSGAPIPGVNVIINGDKPQLTNSDGVCYHDLSNVDLFTLSLIHGNDSLYAPRVYMNDRGNYQPTRREVSTILFTDRQLYRPGQAIYFKGIQLKAAGDKNTLLTGDKLNVTIKDFNGKQLASIPVTTNDFGSFTGTFIISQNVLNGSMTISTPYGARMVQVEDYKRPTFSVAFLPVKNNYKPGDSVMVKGNVIAYSGYGISQARVAFHVTRQLQQLSMLRGRYNPSMRFYQSEEVLVDTIQTKDDGSFEVKFKAIDGKVKDYTYQYSITADVTDASGETRSANSTVTVAENNLKLNANTPAIAFTRDSIRIRAGIDNLDGVTQAGSMHLSVYKLAQPPHVFKQRLWFTTPEKELMTRDEFKSDFPDYAYGKEDDKNNWPETGKLIDKDLQTDGKNQSEFNLDILKSQPTGTYRIKITGKDLHGDTSTLTQYLYLVNEPGKPDKADDWVIPVKTKLAGNGKAEVLVGNGEACHVLVEKYDGAKVIVSRYENIGAGAQRLLEVPVSADERGVVLKFSMEYGNRFYTKDVRIDNVEKSKLDIKFITFRNKLEPGQKEQWKLEISGKNNEREAAEMVAGMYDASLDAIAYNYGWNNVLNIPGNIYGYPVNWSYIPVSTSNSTPLEWLNQYVNPQVRQYEYLAIYDFEEGANRVFTSFERSPANAMLREIAIDEPVGNATVNIRGAAPVAQKITLNGRAIHVDTVEYKASTYNLPSDVVYGSVINDYGDQAQAGRPIAIRKNFAETAFFYPQLRTDDKGQILIDFTIPDELTTWRFMAFAHTKDLQTGYTEQQIITQKELSITTNAPRFLREGDTITVSARLANLTAGTLKGRVHLQLFNALNMQPVSLLLNRNEADQPFELKGNTNKAVSFRIAVPAGLDALDYRITASAGKYADGEENTLPVLPNRMLVTESMPMAVRAGQTKDFTFDKLVNQQSNTLKSKTLTLEYTPNPAWYAVQALPYMMEYPYECSEQTFSRYYANSLAANIVTSMPAIQKVFEQWKSTNSDELLSNLEKNQDLKSTLIEETPWLRDAENETEQKNRIALLFDLNKMQYELRTTLDKLRQKQLPNGGFPWFGGTEADRYITQHILAGIGQLYHSKIADLNNAALKDIADKAMAYLDGELIDEANREKQDKTYDNRVLGQLEIHAYYTQSYFTARTLSAEMKELTTDYLNLAAKQWVGRSPYGQGMIALTMLRNNRPEVAAAIIKSLLENAQQSDEMGMYWAKNRRGYFWYESPVETQSLLIELFTEAGNNDKAVDEMKIWLLRNKQTSDWKTTKATAAACYALLMKGSDLLTQPERASIKLDGKPLEELKPDVKADAGSGYIKTSWHDEQIKPGLGKVEIKNNGNIIGWGALHWQYLENLDKITSSETNIHLERKYFIQKQTDAGPVLTAVDATHQPKTGDLLKVVVYLKADRDFEYVQLKDMRPAGTEPVDILSSYKYQDGLYYYQVTKDVATNFFISYLNKGNYVFEYRLRVAQPGNFSTGITSVQCMYAPEFNAHSPGVRLAFKP